MPMTGSVVVKREIVSEEFEWKIQNFTLTEGPYWTPEFKFQNETWMFQVYPNLIDEYIGLCLRRYPSDSFMNVEFSVALKTSDGQKNFERGWTDIFGEWKYECYYRWLKRSEFERRESEFLSSGCLTFLITLKRVDFVEPGRRRHFFRSKYIPMKNNTSVPISHEGVNISTTRDAVQNENVSQEFEWKIDNFSLVKGSYTSPEFLFQRETWKFRMFPSGSDGFICLRVTRITSGSPLLVEFSVALKTSDDQKSFERVWTEIFDWKYCCDYRWMRRSEFERRQTEFMSSGCLKILITLKVVDAVESATASAVDVRSCCKENVHDDKIAVHKICLDKSLKCPKCSEALNFQNLFDHECQTATVKASTSTNESFVICNHSKFVQDLKQLLLNQENSDVVLRVKDAEFPAHRAILAARSPVFASTFRNDMKEKKTGIVDIVDCDPSVFPNFLCFLYSNDTDSLCGENVFALFKIADKYECLDLRARCLDFIKDNLSVETFCEALTIALQYGEAGLLRIATDFFIKNAKKVLVTVSWQVFATENPIQSNELVIKLAESYGP